ncbi:MAG: hypothetical protein HWQ38_17165 [Nostoc sp. NMS7]|uniref:hypothetical protein n=1 Tax=Nostoc sp. NMS7 TaxID=2815391 RepID=UPI0025EA4A1D|nr:hypothetical protein [Nostoc sp. NMS7]MBN3948091.1 hypothetical protein [Nostoc sp. NMS7]
MEKATFFEGLRASREKSEMSPEEAAGNWDLPVSAIYEAIRYCESHKELMKLEAQEERYRLQEKGISL